MCVYVCTVCSIPPLLTSSADSLQSSNVTRMGKRQKRVHAQLNPASCSKKRAMSPQKAGMCVSTESECDRECMSVCGTLGRCTSVQCLPSPLLTSSADSLQSSNVTRMGTLQTGTRQKRVHMQQNPASCSKKRAVSQKAGMCVCVWGGGEVYIGTVCSTSTSALFDRFNRFTTE